MAGAYIQSNDEPQFMKARTKRETPLWPGTAQAVRRQRPCRGIQRFSLEIPCAVPPWSRSRGRAMLWEAAHDHTVELKPF